MNKFYIVLIVGFLLLGLGVFTKYKTKKEILKNNPDRLAFLEAENYASDYFLSEIGIILIGIGFWGIFFKN